MHSNNNYDNSIPRDPRGGPWGHSSCDFVFDCIPGAHENRARVSRPFLPRAGDAIHPALREWEGSGCETTYKLFSNLRLSVHCIAQHQRVGH